MGPSKMIAVGQFFWILRSLYYAWMPGPMYVLLIEPLHGITL